MLLNNIHYSMTVCEQKAFRFDDQFSNIVRERKLRLCMAGAAEAEEALY
jgi:hypothetical protein